jgi:hypothetical protein
MKKTKVLTKKLIDQILKKPAQEQHPYESFQSIEDEAAIYLSKKVKVSPSLYLSGLTSLSDVAAAAFGKFDCCYQPNMFLHLDGMLTISDQGLKSLANFEGSLSLGGLRELSDAGAKALVSHKGGRLRLGGLTTITESAAQILSGYYKGKYSGDTLTFASLSEIEDGALKQLVKYKGHLGLPGLKTISDTAAKILAEHRGSHLDLGGLKTLSAPAAKALAGYKGFDSVCKTKGQISLGKEAAKVLLKQKGGDAVLFDDE